MDTNIQAVATLLQDVAYAPKLFLKMDYNIYASSPEDENGDVVYEGRLIPKLHADLPHRNRITFFYTDKKGIYDISATRDEDTICNGESMPISQFKAFLIDFLEVPVLYAPKRIIETKSMRPVKYAPTLQELLRFMSNVSQESAGTVKHILYMVFPSDEYGDIYFSGGLWTERQDNNASPEISLDISHTAKRGIFHLQSWIDRCTVRKDEKIAFSEFQQYTRQLFGLTSADTPASNGRDTL